jgi:hypothetical protein
MSYVKLVDEGFENVVKQILWECNGVDDTAQVKSNASGIVTLGPLDPENFTAFEDLTYNQIQEWVNISIDSTSIEAEVGASIDSKINSDIVSMLLPF